MIMDVCKEGQKTKERKDCVKDKRQHKRGRFFGVNMVNGKEHLRTERVTRRETVAV